MNRTRFGQCAGIFAGAVLAAAAQAQSSCTSTLTYTPQNPVVGQVVTVTLNVVDSVPPAPGQDQQYLVVAQAYQEGYPLQGNGEGSLSSFPGGFSFTFAPYSPGQVSLYVYSQAFGSGAANSTCGNPGPGANAVVTVAPPPTVKPKYDGLKGQYAFAFNGLNAQIQGASNRLAAVGSFTADGQGHITAGTEDANSGAGSSTLVPITGSYTLDAAGNGALTLTSSFGVQHLSFFAPAIELTRITAASLFSTDGSILFGGGSLQLQTVPTAAPTTLGAYSLGLSGYMPCTSTCNGGDSIYESGSLSFDTAAGGPHGTLSGSAGTVLLANSPVGDTQFAGVDPVTGRFTFTLSQGQFPSVHFAGYTVDGLHLLLVSTDSHQTTYLLSGTAVQQ